MQRDVVPILCSDERVLALFSGHAHGYERFVRDEEDGCGRRDRHFIVTAGGGGPRPPDLRSAAESGFRDVFSGVAPRPFNFATVSQDDRGVSVTVRGLDRGDSRTRDIDAFRIPWPQASR
jgi:hypothetical protein